MSNGDNVCPSCPSSCPQTSRSGSETLIVSLRCARGEHVENVPHIVEHDFIVLARVLRPTPTTSQDQSRQNRSGEIDSLYLWRVKR